MHAIVRHSLANRHNMFENRNRDIKFFLLQYEINNATKSNINMPRVVEVFEEKSVA